MARSDPCKQLVQDWIGPGGLAQEVAAVRSGQETHAITLHHTGTVPAIRELAAGLALLPQVLAQMLP